MEPEKVFRKIAANKAADMPAFEKLERHRRLVDQLQAAIEDQLAYLEREAFGEWMITDFDDWPVVDLSDPFQAVARAIRANDPAMVQLAAMVGYQNDQLNAVILAAEYDPAIEKLVDHLRTYGPLMNQNQRVFMRFALAEPIGAVA